MGISELRDSVILSLIPLSNVVKFPPRDVPMQYARSQLHLQHCLLNLTMHTTVVRSQKTVLRQCSVLKKTRQIMPWVRLALVARGWAKRCRKSNNC